MQNGRLITSQSSDLALLRTQQRLLLVLLGFLLIVSVIVTFVSAGEGVLPVVTPIVAVTSLIFIVAVTRGRFIQPIGMVITLVLTIASVLSFADDIETIVTTFLLLSMVVLTSALTGTRIFHWLVMVIAGVIVIVTSLLVALNNNPDATLLVLAGEFSLALSGGVIPLVIGGVVRYFVFSLQTVVESEQRGARLLEASSIIGQNMSQTLELNELLDRSVEIIRDRFAFYHVGVFLLDDDRNVVVLTAATGEAGERLLSRGYRLPVNRESVVGRTARARDIIVVRDAQITEAPDRLLQATRSQVGLPIADNEDIIGVLDVQSNRPDAFTDTELQALQVIANQLATAIRNARLFQEKERSIRENKRLFIESETNLREIQRLNRQLTQQAWSDYLRVDNRLEGITYDGHELARDAEWTPQMLDARRRRRPITADQENKRTIAVPIELRGEVVGAIEVETQKMLNSEDTVDMVRAISQRLAVSLDNARLFEESNEATAQEQHIGEIVSQYQSATTVDELLQITLDGLSKSLGAEQASIRVGTLPETFDGSTQPQRPQMNGDNAE